MANSYGADGSDERIVKDTGMIDLGHIDIVCSNCNVPLVDVWITRPNELRRSKIQAMCDHCGDKSFVKEVKGQFYLGTTDYTNLGNIEIDVDDSGTKFNVIVHTHKVKTYE